MPKTRSLLVAAGLLIGLSGLNVATAQAPTGQRPLDPANLDFWKSIRDPALSADGAWFAYVLAPNEGDAELVVRSTGAEATERRFPIGEPPSGGGFGARRDPSVLISGDGHWLAFTVYPTAAAAKKLEKEKKPAQNSVTLLSLSTGTKREFEKVRGFRFAGDHPAWLVLERYPAQGASESDLLLADLRSGVTTTIGSVGEWAIDKDGTQLAWTTAAKDLVGNGVQVRNLATDQVRTLDGAEAIYRKLAWADSGLALAVLRGHADSGSVDTTYAVVAFTAAGSAAPARTVIDPADIDGFPAGMRVSPERAPEWSADFSTVFFGISERRTEKESKHGRPDVKPVAGTPGAMQSTPVGDQDDDLPTLVIWHGKADDRLQSQQEVQEKRDQQFSYLSAYRLADHRYLRLATDELRDVELAPRGAGPSAPTGEPTSDATRSTAAGDRTCTPSTSPREGRR